MRDLVLKLRELRRIAGLSQAELAAMCGIGEKTISSYETGNRIHALTVSDLARIVSACGHTLVDFFAWELPPHVVRAWRHRRVKVCECGDHACLNAPAHERNLCVDCTIACRGAA